MTTPSRPPKEALEALSRLERGAFRLADFCARYMTVPAKAYNTATMGSLLWLSTSNRTNIVGLEHLAALTKNDRVLFVCNHRSFFDSLFCVQDFFGTPTFHDACFFLFVRRFFMIVHSDRS